MTDSTSDDSTGQHRSPAGRPLAHVMPVPVLLAVFATLMVLTAATVAVTWIDLGQWNLAIAMAIATLKATLVALYFMHLRYDHPFNGFIFLVALVFLALFLSLTMLDTLQYLPEIDNWGQLPGRLTR